MQEKTLGSLQSEIIWIATQKMRKKMENICYLLLLEAFQQKTYT